MSLTSQLTTLATRIATEFKTVRSEISAARVVTGSVTQYAGSSAPSGYLLCQGQSLSTTTYASLFAVIGYTYGGSGTSFNLPDLQNRVSVGKRGDNTGTFGSLNAKGGSETHSLTTAEMPSHTHVQDSHNHTQNAHNHTQDWHTHAQDAHAHSVWDPGHNHSQNAHGHNFSFGGTQYDGWQYSTAFGGSISFAAGNAAGGTKTYIAGNTATNNANTTGIGIYNTTATNQWTQATNQASTATNNATTATNQNTGGGGAHNNLQPYIVLNYIIKY